MKTLLLLFLLWVALNTGVYYAAKPLGLPWALPIFAAVTLIGGLWWASRSSKASLNDRAPKDRYN